MFCVTQLASPLRAGMLSPASKLMSRLVQNASSDKLAEGLSFRDFRPLFFEADFGDGDRGAEFLGEQ